MVAFQVVAQHGWADDVLQTADSLALSEDGDRLYVASRSGASLVTYAIGTDQSLTWANSFFLPADHVALGGLPLAMLPLPSPPGSEIDALVPLAVGPNGLSYMSVEASGTLSGAYADLGTGALSGRPTDIETVTVGGGTHVYVSVSGPGQVQHYTLQSGPQPLAAGAHGTMALQGAGANVVDIEHVAIGATTFLVTAAQSGDSLATFRINGAGQAHQVDMIGAEDGLGIDIPTGVEIVTVQGTTYAVLAAAGSSSLSVVALGPYGSLTPTDHVIDSRDTRFDGTVAMAVAQQDGRALVVVGGADDGVSVFEVIPGGRLVHLGSFADQNDTGLQNVQDVAVTWDGDTLQIYAVSATEAGVTHLSVHLGPLGAVVEATGQGGTGLASGTGGRDVLMESDGDDTLSGLGGGDIIMGGTGGDTFLGGAGADVFIIKGDDVADTIGDFEVGVDRIMLDNWAGVIAASDVTVMSHATGGTLRMGDTVLHVQSADNGPLTHGQLTEAITGGITGRPALIDPDAIDNVSPPPDGNTGSDAGGDTGSDTGSNSGSNTGGDTGDNSGDNSGGTDPNPPPEDTFIDIVQAMLGSLEALAVYIGAIIEAVQGLFSALQTLFEPAGTGAQTMADAAMPSGDQSGDYSGDASRDLLGKDPDPDPDAGRTSEGQDSAKLETHNARQSEPLMVPDMAPDTPLPRANADAFVFTSGRDALPESDSAPEDLAGDWAEIGTVTGTVTGTATGTMTGIVTGDDHARGPEDITALPPPADMFDIA